MKAFNIEELRKQAKRRLPRAVFDFIDGGAEDERTLRENRAAFESVRLLRKVLVGVSAGRHGNDHSREDREASDRHRADGRGRLRLARRRRRRGEGRGGLRHPVFAVHLGHREHRAHCRRGARAALVPGLFLQGPRILLRPDRARAQGGLRHADGDRGPAGGRQARARLPQRLLGIPFRFTPRNVLDFATRPAWALDMLLRGVPQLENLAGMAVADQKRTRNIVSSVGRDQDAVARLGGHQARARRLAGQAADQGRGAARGRRARRVGGLRRRDRLQPRRPPARQRTRVLRRAARRGARHRRQGERAAGRRHPARLGHLQGARPRRRRR